MEPVLFPEEGQSSISWSAILAGAAAALAAALVMLALAAGLGLKLGAPWPGQPGGFDKFNPTLGAILVVIQVLSAGLGGYLAGRLRTKWIDIHSHEVHFRDTAHGLIVWAVSTVAGVGLAVGVLAPATAQVATQAAAAAAVQIEPVQAAGIAAQASLFMGVGLRRDEMHARYWSERAR
jgi:hypothetical protein